MKRPNANPKTIAIIGGGVSGALTAYHLAANGVRARVIVIDPRPQIGLGLAYSTPSLRHLLNVRAGEISALPDDPDHFLKWLRQNHDPETTKATFAPRAIFGRYMQSIFEEASGIEQVRGKVVDYRPTHPGTILTLEDGREISANVVGLATGNFDPATPARVSEAATASGAYCHNVWAANTYGTLEPDAPVTLIGTGLTAVDVVLRLRELGHRGVITAVSRHGILPNRHETTEKLTDSAIPAETQATCLGYLRALRRTIRQGMPWRAAIDSLRPRTNALWIALPLEEQQRFRRHLERRWNVTRHRMAPLIADLIDAELRAGTLLIREGRLAGVETHANGAIVHLRHAKGTDSFTTARVINCTGPNMNYRRVDSPLLKRLFAQGLVTPGPLGGGFSCTEDGAMIDANGNVSRTLFNLGPGRLGTLLESIAVPEIRGQAVQLAELLAKRLLRDDIASLPETTDISVVLDRAVA